MVSMKGNVLHRAVLDAWTALLYQCLCACCGVTPLKNQELFQKVICEKPGATGAERDNTDPRRLDSLTSLG